MPTLQAVTFDFWGTLYVEGPHTQRRHALREQLVAEWCRHAGLNAPIDRIRRGFDMLRDDVEHARVVEHCGRHPAQIGAVLAAGLGVELTEPRQVDVALTQLSQMIVISRRWRIFLHGNAGDFGR